MNDEDLINTINTWGESVVQDMVVFLDSINKSNTGALASSLRASARIEGEKIYLEFFGANYSEFVRQGVRGSASSKKAPSSEFRFGSGSGEKGGLRRAIDRWVITKGINGVRDKKGRFIKRKSLVFLISRKIYRFGIRPTNFIFPFFQRREELNKLIGVEFAKRVEFRIINNFNNG